MELMTKPTMVKPEADQVLAIEVNGLSKRYGSTNVVNNLNLAIPQGSIFGFLGPNGAGKTTTIRMLLGLIRASSGQARILGYDVVQERAKILPQVGAIVESPTFYPYLSGRDNLKHLALVAGVNLSRIDDVLELVELTDRAKDKVKTYSLGMKQRLGIAGAMLNNPRIIFLDEPTNGLDPQGTVDMRNLILRLGEKGHTIFLSSHLLHEVEQVCSHVAIINRGTMLVQGQVEQLVSGTGKILMQVSPVKTALHVLSSRLGKEGQITSPNQLEIGIDPERVPEAVQLLVEAGVSIYSIGQQKASLEDYFLEITGTGEARVSSATQLAA
jgi:ABC-type multidrug transport system ATPase subunit